MRWLLVPVLVSLAASGARVARAQTSDTSLSADEARLLAAVDTNVIRRVMVTLASRAYEGRMPGSRGGERAESLLAGEFGRVGLRPLGDGGTYLQRVPLRRARVLDPTTLRVHGTTLTWPSDFTVSPGNLRDSVSFNAPVTYVRVGRAHDDNSVPPIAADVRGRIVVALFRPFASRDRLNTGASFQFYTALRRAGAAMIIIANAHAPDEAPAPPVEQRRWRVLAPDPAATSSLVAPMFVLGDSATARLLRAIGLSYEAERQASMNDSIAWRPLSDIGSITLHAEVHDTAGHNVIGYVEGSDPSLGRQAVMLTAHHDHFGIAPDGAIFAGAVDDAMGVGDVVAAAHALARTRSRPRRSMIFMITTGEEFNLAGARYFAQHPTWPRDSIVADVNVEGDNPDWPWPKRRFVHAYNADSAITRVLAGAAQSLDIGMTGDFAPEQHGETRSDAAAFSQGGIRSAFITIAPDSAGGATRYFAAGAAWYHTPADTVHADWAYGAMRTKTELALLLAWRLAGGR